MPQARFALLDDRGILAVSGADRRIFLQGLVSNDVERISPEQAGYAALLTAQGKYLHDFMMIEFGGAIWLEAEAVIGRETFLSEARAFQRRSDIRAWQDAARTERREPRVDKNDTGGK